MDFINAALKPNFNGYGGIDYTLYMEATRRWLAGGSFYEPYQLAGPYPIQMGDVLYAPNALPLFVAFTALPAILWWAIPLGVTAWAIWRVRPAPVAWPFMALCIFWPPMVARTVAGNPVMWVMAAVALGFVVRWAFVGVLLKPSLFPFALLGARSREWWIALALWVAISHPVRGAVVRLAERRDELDRRRAALLVAGRPDPAVAGHRGSDALTAMKAGSPTMGVVDRARLGYAPPRHGKPGSTIRDRRDARHRGRIRARPGRAVSRPIAFDAQAYWAANPGSSTKPDGRAREYARIPVLPGLCGRPRAIPTAVGPHLHRALAARAVHRACLVLRGWSLVLVVAGLLWFVVPIPILGVVMADIAHGNIQILLGAVAVLGLRYPALWSFALLSKVTPGIGLLWFVARGEWRNLAIGLAVTGAIALVSFLYIPGDWFAWATFLRDSVSVVFPQWVVPVPLGIRLATGAALIVWGARTDRPWVLPIACGWVIPMPYLSMLTTMAFALYYVPRRRLRSDSQPSPATV